MDDTDLEMIRQRKLVEMMRRQLRPEDDMPSHPIEVTDAGIEDFIGSYYAAVLDCWAPWCAPCKMIDPIIEDLASKYASRVAFGKLNTDMNVRTAARFSVMSIPTLLFFRAGKLVDRLTGVHSAHIIEEHVKRLI